MKLQWVKFAFSGLRNVWADRVWARGAPDARRAVSDPGMRRVPRPCRGLVPAAAAAMLVAPLIHADPAQVELSDAMGNGGAAAAQSSTIGPALRRSSGVVTLNQAAGDGNVQQNSAALAESEGHSVASADAQQAAERLTPQMNQILAADIQSGAFDDSFGIYLINQSAGAGNSQFNGAALAVGGVSALAIVQLDDSQLQEQSTGAAVDSLPNEGGAQVSTSADLAPDAFEGARGLFLVNQAAGNNNATANTFTLSASP